MSKIDILNFIEERGWHITWFFNHNSWQASYKGKYIAHGGNAKSYQEAVEQFLAYMFTTLEESQAQQEKIDCGELYYIANEHPLSLHDYADTILKLIKVYESYKHV